MIDTSGFALPKPGAGSVHLTPYGRRKQRERLWRERKHDCYLCGSPIVRFEDVELDHRIPGKMGGCKDDSDDNQELTHRWCNRKKGSRRL